MYIVQGALLRKEHIQFYTTGHFACYVNDNCGVSGPHKSEEHIHERHGHKTTTSSEHWEETKAEGKGISFICNGSNALVVLHTVVYL